MRTLLPFLLGVTVAAQTMQTFVVDAANGPGAHFTDITAAVAAVPDGSTLIVRPGGYAPVVVDGKGVTILCDAGVAAGDGQYAWFLDVRHTQPHQVVAVRRLLPNAMLGLRVADTLGPVVVDGVGSHIRMDVFFGAALSVLRSRQVVLRGWQTHADEGCYVEDSSVVIESCALTGSAFFPMNKSGGQGPNAAVRALRSEVQLVQTTAVGGSQTLSGYSRLPAPAVRLDQSNLRVMGSSSHVLFGGFDALGARQASIAGLGVARVDPLIPSTGGTAGTGIGLSRLPMSTIASTDAAPGGTLVAQRFGAIGTAFVLALGLPAPRVSFSTIADPLWFDPARYGIEAVGVTVLSTPLVVTRAVPNQPGLVGVNLVWQAADIDAQGVIEFSNPSPTFVR